MKLTMSMIDSACHGCMSVNRMLIPLKEHQELFFTLLQWQGSKDFSDNLNIVLCWECHAILKRTLGYCKQIQISQYMLNQASTNLNIKFQSLSHLNIKTKDGYDVSFEHLDIDTETCIKRDIKIINSYIKRDTADTDKEVNFKVYGDDIDSETHFIAYTADIDNNDDTKKVKADGDVMAIKLEEIDTKDEIPIDNYFPDNDYGLLDKNSIPSKKLPRKYSKRKFYKDIVKQEKTNIDTTDPYKYCTKMILSENDIKNILNKRRNSSTYLLNEKKCELCARSFSKLHFASAHKKNKHSQRQGSHKCAGCSAVYPTKFDAELHAMQHHGVYKCNLCSSVGVRPNLFPTHLTQAHMLVFRCLSCGLGFGTLVEFKSHYKKYHDRFICDYCNKVVKSKRRIETHISKLHMAFECKPCNKKYATYRSYESHLRMGHGVTPKFGKTGPAYCVECDKEYVNVFRYKRHLVNSPRHTNKMKVSVPCPECGKAFASKSYMTNHYNLHHDTKNNKNYCEICDRNYLSNADLRKHRRKVHEGIQPPKNKICYICGRGFSHKRILTNHMRTHTGERPFACSLCPAAFAQKVALTSHTRAIHSIIKQHSKSASCE